MSRQPRVKSHSEDRREREVLQYIAAYEHLPRLEDLDAGPELSQLPPDHKAQRSTDSTLISLCQFAALRMNAQRALISLIDGQRQHVLAEATPRTPLCSSGGGVKVDGKNDLWLGSVSIPRSWGVCEQVLGLGLDAANAPVDAGSSVIINEDLLQSSPHAQRTYVRDGPRVRFYAGAALIGINGGIVGALCVFDDQPRPGGVPAEDVTFLEDLATAITEYLGTYTVKDRFRRGEKLTRGLISFTEGASGLLPLDQNKRSDNVLYSPVATTSSSVGSTTLPASLPDARAQKDHLRCVETVDVTSETSKVAPSSSLQGLAGQGKEHITAKSDTTRASATHNTSLRALQDTILPANSRDMFKRAAHVIIASSDLDGVLILDASVAATGHRQHPAAPEHQGRGDSPSNSSDPDPKSESSEDSSSQRSNDNRGPHSIFEKQCQILGIALSGSGEDSDSTLSTGSLSETSLALLLRENPYGKIFNYSAEGVFVSSTDESSSNKDLNDDDSGKTRARSRGERRRSQTARSSKAISDLLPNARSVAFVPFWDYERSRWFAGCLCWTNNPDRLLSVAVDLPYFNIFSHSIMRELSRLDALALNQQKSTFVASISHELRSPLHGILGTLEFIKETQLDPFQVSMLDSLNSCGQTLLDTINHLMDHSKMSETAKSISSKRLKNTQTVQLLSKPLRNQRLLQDPPFDLCMATEEVVEAVFAGASFLPIMNSRQAPLLSTESTSPTSSSTEKTDPTTKRKTCYIILDIAPEQDWTYCFPVGSWKRTVMNLFGNALKYTHSGHIVVSLHAAHSPKPTGPDSTITLTITDTGAGMSPSFLANKAFQPFSQENTHSSGVGLGLSIVRQIIETKGGKIEVNSDPSGTRMTIKLSLTKPENNPPTLIRRIDYQSWLPRLQDRKVCILHRPATDQDILDEPQNAQGLARFTHALITTLVKHLKMRVVQTTEWRDNDTDLVICPEPSFDYLASIRDRRTTFDAEKAPVTIFVALDALEAATLRSDMRVQNKESVVEIVTQPLGPFKLAYVLNTCLDRFQHSDENSHRTEPSSNVEFPRPLPLSPTQSMSYSPAPADMPPLMDQPYWQQNEKSVAPVASNPLGILMPASKSPNAARQVLPVHSESTTTSAATNKTTKILITDDNVINRRLLVAYMKKSNLDYVEAENGLEALRIYQSASAQFDAILMDMSMPVMDGISATRAIRQYEKEYKIPRCYIVALTGLASASAKLEAWNAGIDHFMIKPINFRALTTSLSKAKAKRNGNENTTEATVTTPAPTSSES